MNSIPDAIFIIDTNKAMAVLEANNLNIPVIAALILTQTIWR